MDKTEQRLKREANRLSARVSPSLRARIDASLHGVTPQGERPKRSDFDFSLWLAASLTGVAAAVLVVMLTYHDVERVPPPADAAVARSVPEYARELERELPLRVETADLTAPLEEELEDLKSDMQKARESVERDLDFSF